MNGRLQKLKTEAVSRQVIEDTLLTALEDASTVAILATRKDLDLLIHSLVFVSNDDAREMETSLRQLREQAFNK